LTATFHLAQLYARTAQYARAADLNARLVDAAGDACPEGPQPLGTAQLVVARLWLLWCLAELGSFAEGLRRADLLVRTAVEPFDRLTVQLGLGLLYLRQGRLAEAIVTLEGALPLCRAGNLAVWFPAIASPLGYACALRGRVADGLSLLQQAVEATAQRGAVHPLRTAHLAEAHLLGGDAERARELAGQALEAARLRGERAHEAYALRILGRSADETSGLAVGHLGAAIQLADELTMRPLAAQARLDLARAYDRQGLMAARDAAAAAAAPLLEAMAMRDWLAQEA
jgi:tetratricopeptide (TPR) repeat protein